jgi:hypothetical protein
MKSILLDDNKDFAIVKNNLVLVSGLQSTKQRLDGVLSIFQGSWFLDLALGVPYNEQILIKGVVFSVVRDTFIDKILSVPDVLHIRSFLLNYEPRNRNLSLEFSCICSDGELEQSTTVNFGV